MASPAILLLPCVFAVTVKKAPKFCPSRDWNTLPTTGASPKWVMYVVEHRTHRTRGRGPFHDAVDDLAATAAVNHLE